MRDPSKYSEEKRWTEEESDLVDQMLKLWREKPMLSNDDVVTKLMQDDEKISKEFLLKVLEKCQHFLICSRLQTPNNYCTP